MAPKLADGGWRSRTKRADEDEGGIKTKTLFRVGKKGLRGKAKAKAKAKSPGLKD